MEFTEAEMQEFMDGLNGQDTTPEGQEETTASQETPEAETGAAEAGEVEATEEQIETEKQAEKQPQTYTIKVNKEERQVTLDEMTALAQKGADYDRVKEQVQTQQAQFQQETETLKKFFDENRQLVDVLQMVAWNNKTTVQEVVQEFRLQTLTRGGLSEDAAKERIAREDAERELQKFREAVEQKNSAEQRTAERAAREIAEFKKKHPDVNLDDSMLQKLSPDVQNGMTLSEAYQNQQAKEAQAKIKELEAQLAAEKQNNFNKQTSTSPASDDGGHQKDEYSDFWGNFH